MKLINIGIATVNPTVGKIAGNTDMVLDAMSTMAKQGVTVATFGEQVLGGYPCEDLVQWPRYTMLQAEGLKRIADASKAYRMLASIGLSIRANGGIYNVMALVGGGRIFGLVPKEGLPDYGIFYDGRTHTPNYEGLVLDEIEHLPGVRAGDFLFSTPFGLMEEQTCEDIWKPQPMERRSYRGSIISLNGSASPFRSGIHKTRERMVTSRSADYLTTVVYTNLYGGQDGIVFDGGAYVGQGGELLKQVPQWNEGISTCVVNLSDMLRARAENTTFRRDAAEWRRKNGPQTHLTIPVDIELETPVITGWTPIPAHHSMSTPGPVEDVRSAVEKYFDDLIEAKALSLMDYYLKTGCFKGLLVSLSGGRDSGLAAVIARIVAERVGRKIGIAEEKLDEFIFTMVLCVSFPTEHNSDDTKNAARDLAHALGLRFHEESIQEAYEYEKRLAVERQIALGGGPILADNVDQNLQARIRGLRCWTISNQLNLLWVQTGNKDEKAVGYTTIGGDMMGCFSIIANEKKTDIIDELRHIAIHLCTRYPKWAPAIRAILGIESSAELKKGQTDEKDLMPFIVLEAFYDLFVAKKLDPVDCYTIIRHHWSDEEFLAMRSDYQPGMLKDWAVKYFSLFMRSVYKWAQCPPATHLDAVDFDRERALQIPIVSDLEWLGLGRIKELPN